MVEVDARDEVVGVVVDNVVTVGGWMMSRAWDAEFEQAASSKPRTPSHFQTTTLKVPSFCGGSALWEDGITRDKGSIQMRFGNGP